MEDMAGTASVMSTKDPALQKYKSETARYGPRMHQYMDNEGKSSVYYMQPKSNNIYMYNFQKDEMIGESLKWPAGVKAEHPQ